MTTKENTLAPDLTLRAVKWSDRDAVAKLIYDVCEHDGDVTVAVTPQDLEHEWHNEGFHLETDAICVETTDGRVVGFEEFTNTHKHYSLNTDGYIHPEFTGRGIGTTLLRMIETRAREEMKLAESDLRVFLRSTIDNRDDASNELHKAEGYSPKRYHWRMEIKLDSAPLMATWPEGIEPRPFIRNQDEIAVWQAQNEAFRDHWV